ncbi:DUF6789 family protein [Halorarum halobium]|uniref:DUF6789 family protein n=1 Tax=Halorarum halobium TaxID=3075121 RepID=UPI0028A996D9|nr:DUF6789 family protein [Halobaculum sp. XH14]
MSNSAETATSTESESDGSSDITPRKLAIAGGAGLVGVLAMAPLLVAAAALGALSPTEFASLATFLGVAVPSPWAFPVGVALFVAIGMTMLPTLFVALAGSLPPSRSIGLRGVVFASIVWTGFFFAFGANRAEGTFWTFVVVTLLAHFVYGYVLGSLFARFARIPRYDV